MTIYRRGSEWRRWDPHVHTPYSVLNSEFGVDFDEYARRLLTAGFDAEVCAIGVTDYFLIDGYAELRVLLADHDRLTELVAADVAEYARTLLVFPNVELRTSVVVNDSRVNFHIMFDPDVAVSVIDESFLRELKFAVEGRPDTPDQLRSLTRANLEELGRELKEQHEPFRDRSDLVIGMTNAVIAHEQVSTVLETHRRLFSDRYMIVVPADEDLSVCPWDSQAHLVRKLLIQKAHALFSSNAQTRKFALGKLHSSPEDYKREFKTLKPCIHGSDAHSFDSMFRPDGDRYTWIKADPTFPGLRQILHEPEDRVFIGLRPPALTRVEESPTKFIESLEFERLASAPAGQVWFSGRVEFNAGLVAIIGNKGSGKSALADIIGHLGGASTRQYFSFLTKERFLSPRQKLGGGFLGRLQWRSGDTAERTLSEPPPASATERVKYIPQNYLETICTELRDAGESMFDREVEEVIYSHVDIADRLGHAELPQLLKYKTEEKEARVTLLIERLAAVNDVIAATERRMTSEHREGIEDSLLTRQRELAAHDGVKPAEVPEPAKDPDALAASTSTGARLSVVVQQIETLDAEIAQANSVATQAAQVRAAAERLQERLANLEERVEAFRAESADEATLLGLDLGAILELRVNREPVNAARSAALEQETTARRSLDPADGASLVARRLVLSAEADSLRQQLDAPTRRYETYRHELARWESVRAAIVGSAVEPGSIAALEAELAGLVALPAELATREEERLVIVRELFETKSALLDDYRSLYAPVQRFVEDHPVSREVDALSFTATMALHGFADRFLGLLHQGRRGSFQGDREGSERVRQLIASAELASWDGVVEWLDEIAQALRKDLRDSPPKRNDIASQLRQGKSLSDLYNFVFGLDYLRPRFELRWQDKTLDQLSPGERGSLLLVFYLLIDRRDVPLVIDQPEENLDNQTITLLLVPAMKYAKQRRQIIIVTHNPNLAVVCDADQIIHADLDKAAGNAVSYTSGSIEQPAITQLIVDVLEGTKPAFDLRDAKYEILERE